MSEPLVVAIDTFNELSTGVSSSSNPTNTRTRTRATRTSNTNTSVGQRGRPKRANNQRNARIRTNRSNGENNNSSDSNINDVIMGQTIATNNIDSQESTQRADNENNLNAITDNVTQTTTTHNNSNESDSTTNGRDIVILNETCIDLTQDESVVNENSVESDSEIQCISSFIRNPPVVELSIIRETNINRRRTINTRERSRSPITRRGRSDDIIEIINSQSDTRVSNGDNIGSNVDNRRRSLRKAIKCPICLEEDSAFEISGRQLVSTNCGHVFCDRCIKEVIKTSKMCPNCRKRVSTQRSFHPLYI